MAEPSWTFQQLLEAFAGERGLCRPVPLYRDPRCEQEIPQSQWQMSLAQMGFKNGAILFANLAPFPPSTLEELGLTRPPRPGPECTHDPSMRCPKCYEAWRQMCRMARSAEEAELYSDLELPEEPQPRFGEKSRDMAYLQYLESIQPVIKAEEPGTEPVIVSENAWHRMQAVVQSAHKLDQSPTGVSCRADCYGRYEADGSVTVEAFRIPPQTPPARVELLPQLRPDPDQGAVDAVAEALGMRCVGQLFTVPAGRSLDSAALTSHEVLAAARAQLKRGRHCVTLIAQFDQRTSAFDMQAYRASAQLCKLIKAGYIEGARDDVSVAIRAGKAVKINYASVHEVPVEYFTVLVPIRAAAAGQLLLDAVYPLDAVFSRDWTRLQQFVQRRMREGLGADRVFADFGALCQLALGGGEAIAVQTAKIVRHHDSLAPISDAVARVNQLAGGR